MPAALRPPHSHECGYGNTAEERSMAPRAWLLLGIALGLVWNGPRGAGSPPTEVGKVNPAKSRYHLAGGRGPHVDPGGTTQRGTQGSGLGR